MVRRPPSPRRLLALVLGLFLGAVVLGAAGAAGQSAISEGAPESSDHAVLDDAVGSLQVEAQNRWPVSFAGVWRDPDSSADTVFVAFTEGAAAKVEELAAAFPRPELLRAVTVERSLADLRSIQHDLVTDRELVRTGALDLPGVPRARYDLDVRIPENTVLAILEEKTDAAVDAFQARYGPAVRVTSGRLAVPDVCTSRSVCSPDLRSGLNVTGGGFRCSSAFSVRYNGNEQILSAGHCPALERSHGGLRYGEVREQQTRGRLDAERHSVEGLFHSKPLIYDTDAQKAREVYTTGRYGFMAIGNTVCKSGVTTGKTCGRVNSIDYSPSYIENSDSFILTDYCSEGGDSGAGVYLGGTALGIHSGGSPDECSDYDDFAIFGHIDFVDQQLDVRVAGTPGT
ncbi:MAG: S1 family peptidase [Thermoleophilaceae bacterium]